MTYSFRKPKFAGKPWEKKQKPASTPAPEPPLGPLLSTIVKTDLIVDSREYVPAARITDCQYVASFNWRDAWKPSVFIPGESPIRVAAYPSEPSQGNNSGLTNVKENHPSGPPSASPSSFA